MTTKRIFLGLLVAILSVPLMFLTACNNADEQAAAEVSNFVDERHQLVSAVFRLANRPGHTDIFTEHQISISAAFIDLREHPVVEFLANYPNLAHDDALLLAVHLEKVGNEFALVNDINNLVAHQGGETHWTQENAAAFVELLNDFYTISNFGEFFEYNYDYYMDYSIDFAENLYNQINFGWFSQRGLGERDLRIFLHPGDDVGGHGAATNEAVYATIGSYMALDSVSTHMMVVQTFVTVLVRNQAQELYAENTDFARWVDETVNPAQLPDYITAEAIAAQYLARAYTIYYLSDNLGANVSQLTSLEKLQGFLHIDNVFTMISGQEVPFIGIQDILGASHLDGEEQSTTTEDGRVITWQTIEVLSAIDVDEFAFFGQTSNAFGTETGDALRVTVDGLPYLYVDLGGAAHLGLSGEHRMYSVFPLY